MSDIIREVDEAVRQDQAREWWNRYGNWVVGACVGVVVAVAAWQGWSVYRDDQRGAAGAAFSVAVADAGKDAKTAIPALERIAAGGVEPYAGFARLKIAQLKAESGDKPAAAAAYDAAAKAAASEDLRDVAILLGAMQAFDTAPSDELIARLQPLTAAGRPLRPSAMELTAALALKAGDTARARTLWIEIAADPGAPTTLRDRVRELLAAAGGEPPTPAPTPAKP
ncbi:MAG: tetratricopeptide repeat protein [Rhodospirillales bacterium]|nr:MAG: tetratricopeptide repeat protein [Rhodospirillales bacterium]